jgi:hypothetical protein
MPAPLKAPSHAVTIHRVDGPHIRGNAKTVYGATTRERATHPRSCATSLRANCYMLAVEELLGTGTGRMKTWPSTPQERFPGGLVKRLHARGHQNQGTYKSGSVQAPGELRALAFAQAAERLAG